jgi:5'-3' exonuclease
VKIFLALDATYLCHVSFYVFRWRPDGVLYGFLHYVLQLTELIVPNYTIFCFDSPSSYRKEIFPDYKKARKEYEDPYETKELYRQVSILQQEVLPVLGFSNVWACEGFEADDLMASVAFRVPAEDFVVLATDDSDLYQVLRENVVIYQVRKKKFIGQSRFRSQYQVDPTDWAFVKAIAGCRSDGVPGVPGVGEKTALKLLRNKREEALQLYREVIEKNLPLVKLPFEGVPHLQVKEDRLSKEGWAKICRRYQLEYESQQGSPV